jgi:ribonuclease P protein component
MTLQVLPREDLSTAEVAFLTPKRLGPAVVRTRLRRRMREIYRRFLSQVAPGHYLVWVARAGAIDLDATALELCMRNLAQRVASKR